MRHFLYTSSLALTLLSSLTAAPITAGDVTTALGPNFIFDQASTGGGDHTTTNLERDFSSIWQPGATVTLTGIGWASPVSGTSNTSVTLTFSEPGPDFTFGTSDDVTLGTITDSLTFSGSSEYAWKFDTPLTFVASSSTLRATITSSATIRRKTTATTQTTANDTKFSLAGTVSPPTAGVSYTAPNSGFWDELAWNTSSTPINANDSITIGENRNVTYRGIPNTQSVSAITLGVSSTKTGQGTLNIDSGTLSITSNLICGFGNIANDSFVNIMGGSLHVQGDAFFGRHAPACDGSLILSGGSAQFLGSLYMGDHNQGGSMIRFHNLGASPPISVKSTLALDRCALDLTFDSTYTHTPGSVTTIANFNSRTGQFINFRHNEEKNFGPNRFKISYNSNSITLTALPNYPSSPNRPNIILLFCDDGGYADLQIHGSPNFPTPALDSLAKAGARFTDAYMTGGVCHPSRCGVLTGRYQQRYGGDNNLPEAAAANDPAHDGMGIAQQTIPSRLQSLGYRTYGIGKWHLGDTVEYHPNLRGFNQWYGMWGGSRPYYESILPSDVFQNQMTPDFTSETNPAYMTDRIGDKTCEFIDKHKKSGTTEPFFMYVAFTAVHTPIDIKSTDPRFARLAKEFGLTAESYANSSPNFNGNQATVDKKRYELAAMTLALDEQVAKIVKQLEDSGLTNNTLIAYSNDNGGPGWNSSFGGNYSYNTPLRGYKGGNMYDGSIRVPCVLKWPGKIPANQVISDPIISLDLGATFVNAANDAPPTVRNGLDGLDLMPLLSQGIPLPSNRVLTWRHGGGITGGSAIRMGDWKLYTDNATGNTMLFNLRRNINESATLDQSANQPALFNELRQRFLAWESRTIAPLYGSDTTVVDANLERIPLSGAYRLNNRSSSLAWLSAPFRTALPSNQDFGFHFLARPTDPTTGNANQFAYAISDSDTRTSFIRAIVDVSRRQIQLINGKNNTSATSPIPLPPTTFSEGSLTYSAATNTLRFTFLGASVSLPLNQSHASFTHYAVATSAMEAELTSLMSSSSTNMGNSASCSTAVTPDVINHYLQFPSMPPFDPIPQRSNNLESFTNDPDTLIENLGGGLYRASTPHSNAPQQFYRFILDQP